MPGPVADELWDDLHGQVGDVLRVVTVFDRMDYDAHVRPDLDREVSDEIARFVDHNIVDRFSEERLRETAGFSELESVVRFYPEAVVVAWSPSGEGRRGVLVSFDRVDDAMSDLERVLAYLDGGVGFDTE